MKKATLGGGCFWCVESVFKMLTGVESVTSGYAGGNTEHPSYEAVCSGTTGHAEVVQIEYDEEIITFDELLDVFFQSHNPTTRDREGPDVGSQYRSIILFHDEQQKEQAKQKIQDLLVEDYEQIVTEIMKLDEFYEAEEKHQDFFEKNPHSAYCQIHIPSKKSKINEKYPEMVESSD